MLRNDGADLVCVRVGMNRNVDEFAKPGAGMGCSMRLASKRRRGRVVTTRGA